MKNKLLAARVEDDLYDRVNEAARFQHVKVSTLVYRYIQGAIDVEGRGENRASIPKNAPDQDGEEDREIVFPEYEMTITGKGRDLFFADLNSNLKMEIINPLIKKLVINQERVIKELEAVADLFAEYHEYRQRKVENADVADAKGAHAIGDKTEPVKDDFRPVMYLQSKMVKWLKGAVPIDENNPMCLVCKSKRITRGRRGYECPDCGAGVEKEKNTPESPVQPEPQVQASDMKPDEDQAQEVQDKDLPAAPPEPPVQSETPESKKKKDENRAQEYRVGTGDVSDAWN